MANQDDKTGDWGKDAVADSSPSPGVVDETETVSEQAEADASNAQDSLPPEPPKPVVETKPEDSDNFPKDLKGALALYQSLQGADRLTDKASAEDKARAAKYRRLKAHVFQLQQGTHCEVYAPMTSSEKLMQVARQQEARVNPVVRELLAENEALKKVASIEGAQEMIQALADEFVRINKDAASAKVVPKFAKWAMTRICVETK
ncbi:MAG: hypothetical protein KGL39_27165 [Patescibacteria group bacterium]|nr:hypothetical protein [Patescibacteria group bacterium]